MRVVVLALLLAGCRQLLGFEDPNVPGTGDDGPNSDGPIDGTPLGVDTDGDGIDDAFDNCVDTPNPDQADEDIDFKGDLCDPCPHLNGIITAADVDGDGDGIGDGCDPNPNTMGDELVRFDAFNSGNLPAAYSVIGGLASDYAVTNGTLVLDTTATEHVLLADAGAPNGTIDIVFDRTAGNGAPELTLAVDASATFGKAFLCTVEPAVPEEAAEKLDGNTRTSLLSLGNAGPNNGRFVAGGHPTTIHCNWPSTGTSIANPTITRLGNTRVGILIRSMHVAIHSIAIYRSP